MPDIGGAERYRDGPGWYTYTAKLVRRWARSHRRTGSSARLGAYFERRVGAAVQVWLENQLGGSNLFHDLVRPDHVTGADLDRSRRGLDPDAVGSPRQLPQALERLNDRLAAHWPRGLRAAASWWVGANTGTPSAVLTQRFEQWLTPWLTGCYGNYYRIVFNLSVAARHVKA